MKHTQAIATVLCLCLLSIGEVLGIGNIANETKRRLDSRDGNSVDTATGAFVQELNLISIAGARPLELNLTYNSFLCSRRGDSGYGWSHQYEGRIEIEAEGVVTVYIDRNRGNQFQYAGEGNPYTPLNEQNRYDVLERVTLGEGADAVNDIWQLRKPSGATYFFNPQTTVVSYPLGSGGAFVDSESYQLLAIRNRNGQTVSVNYNDDSRVNEIKVGDRGIYAFYRPNGTKLLHYLVHAPYHTFLQYDSNDRLSRIYSPVSLETLAESNQQMATVFGGNGVIYPITVLASEGGRLLRLSGRIVHSRPDTLQAFLISPSGSSVEVTNFQRGNLFTDAFLGESTAGSWKLRVVDNANDGIDGVIQSLQIIRSKEAANWTQYEYGTFPDNRIARASDGNGRRIYSNFYDAAGRVSFQDDGRDDNGGWRFAYEWQAGGDILTTVYDRTASAFPTRYRHDSRCHLLSVEDAFGQIIRFAYDPVTGDRTSIIDARGNRTRFNYDANGQLTTLIQPNDARVSFGYDQFPVTEQDGKEADGSGRGNLTSVTDALNFQSTFQYDAFNNLTSSKNALEAQQVKVYDNDGMMTGLINKGGQTAFYTYDNGLMTAANVEDSPKEKIEYDVAGRVVKMIDGEGHPSLIEYDSRGNIVTQSNALGHTLKFRYDRRNLLISETNARGNVTRYEYDGNGNPTRLINALGQVTQYFYDGEDRLIRAIDPAGNVTQTRYDAIGQIDAKIDALGIATYFSYDKAGNRTAVFSSSNIKLSETVYNELNAIESITDANGNTTRFEYDSRGIQTAIIDAEGKRTELRIDGLGRIDRVIDPLNREFAKTFEEDDVVARVSDAGKKETRFTYTEKNELATFTTPGGFKTTLEYTANGQISRYLPPSLKAQEYLYNSANRLQRIKYNDPGVSDTIYSYDENGNVTSINKQEIGAGQVTLISRSYDELDRQIANTDADGIIIRHLYNASGLVSQIVYPDSKSVFYTYDAEGRMKTLTDWAGRVTRYSWNSLGRMTAIAFPNGTSRSMSYDSGGRLTGRTDFDAQGSVIVSYDYDYDRIGFITSESNHEDTVAYEPSIHLFSYDDDNRLISKNGVAISYDNDGNVISGPVGGQATEMQWDHRNNLESAGLTAFSYDVEDRLTGWQVGDDTVKLATIGAANGSQIFVSDSSLSGKTRYVYGVGLAYEERNGEILVHHYDERGNTVALTGESGDLSGRITYSPFGEIIDETGDTGTLFKYGGLFGVVTGPKGLNYMRFRWYSPEMKRFISMDSSLGDITLPGSLNRYSYAGNNPVNFVDPEGEFFAAIAGAVVGTVIGAVVEVVSSAIQGKPIRWENVAAAAIGGAVMGALAGAGCPTCGGALGSVAEDLVGAGLKGETVDFGQVALGAAQGAAIARVGSKISKKYSKLAARRAAGKTLAKMGLPQAGTISRRLPMKELPKLVVKKTLKDALTNESINRTRKVPLSIVGSVAGDKINMSDVLAPGLDSDGSTPPGRTGKIIVGASTLPNAGIGRGGEYLHYQKYLSALTAADRVLPDPVIHLSTF